MAGPRPGRKTVELVCLACQKKFLREEAEHNRNVRLGRAELCTSQEDNVGKTVPLTDHRGNVVEVGHTVAFNLSGQIGMGEVISTRRAVRVDSTTLRPRAEIKVKISFPRSRKGKIATVKDSKNVLVFWE